MQSSNSHPPGPKTFNLFSASTIQYLVLAGLAYILAGAPLLEHLSALTTPSSSSTPKSTWDTTTSKSSRNGFPAPPAYLENLVFPDKNLTCGEHSYKGVYVLNREPLVVYIEGFLSEEESRHVVEERYVNLLVKLVSLSLFLLCFSRSMKIDRQMLFFLCLFPLPLTPPVHSTRTYHHSFFN